MRQITALFAGLLFGAGLIVSDMVNPARVRAFLDVFGEWDPSMAFVMIGAISVTAIAWRIAAKRTESYLGEPLPGQPNPKIDGRLISGSTLFGIGWGAVGTCAAPGVAAIGFGKWEIILFFVAMVVGMALYQNWGALFGKGSGKASRA